MKTRIVCFICIVNGESVLRVLSPVWARPSPLVSRDVYVSRGRCSLWCGIR